MDPSLKFVKSKRFFENQTPAPPNETQKHRQFVIAEFMATEKAYYDKLQALMNVFVIPLEKKNVLSVKDYNMQFAGLKKIFAVHEKMFTSLFAYNDTKEVLMSEVFGEFVLNLSDYQDYLVNFGPAIIRRGELQTRNRRFASYVAKAEIDPRCFGESFESLLIAPVQRIPRYRLLFEDLLKYTPSNHPEYNEVIGALDKIKLVADQNNEAIRTRERHEKLMSIMMKIEDTTRIDLLDNPERYLIREGILKRQCRRDIRPFQFYLFTDIFIYCEVNPIIKVMKLNKVIELSSCQINASPLVENSNLAFAINSSNKSFVAWAETVEEKEGWVRDIKCAVQESLHVNSSVDRVNMQSLSFGKVAPIWNPDASASQCQKCDKAFTLFHRRHHCRNCGYVVCGDCSPNRFRLVNVDPDRDVRVCNDCFEHLSATANTTTISSPISSPRQTQPRQTQPRQTQPSQR